MKEVCRRILVAALVVIVLVGLFATGLVRAEQEEETVWVLCQPESYVNIRENPRKTARKIGYAWCGDDFRTDGKIRNGFIHVRAGTETGEGWISTGYIVYCQPQEVGEVWRTECNGRVAVRATIDGKRTRWIHDGDPVQVYWVAEVALTSIGFVQAEFLTPEKKD